MWVMQPTHRPRPHVLAGLAACGLLLAGAATAPALAAPPPQAPPAAVQPGQTSTSLRDHITDDADLLDDAAAQKSVDTLAAEGVGLWVVTMSDSSQTAEEYAAAAWKDSALGTADLLLVINRTDSATTYAFGGSERNSVWSASKTDKVRENILARLKNEDYDGAVAEISGSSDSKGSGAAIVLGAGAVAALAGGAAAYAATNRRKRGGRDGARVEDLDALRTRAGQALVTADDAVRAADEELSYAQAQFGLTATDAFAQALTAAREHVARSFELRKILDDDIPETEPQQRQMYEEILSLCQEAVGAISAQEEEFNKRRGLESNLPASIAETAQRADETEQAISASRSLLATLQATYPASALTSIGQAPERGQALLDAGRTALAQARASLDAGQQTTAVEQVRLAQGSIAQAGALAAQVTGARERLASAEADLQAAIASISQDLVDAERLAPQIPAASLSPLVADAEAAIAAGRAVSAAPPSGGASQEAGAGDPLAALDHLARAEAALDAALAPARHKEDNDSRARASVGSRLTRLNSQIDAVTSYITTHRGAVGASARTALSEASRHGAAATSLQPTDPAAALAEVVQGEQLAARAQALAEADVRNGSDSFGGSSRGSSGGIDLGSLVLGGILLGGGGGHRGGYGGWGGHSGGGFGGGGFGGGGSFGGGGGGGFGGSGGRV